MRDALPSRTRRGRPPKPAAETPAARVARLQTELEAAQAVLRAESDRAAAILGRAVLAHMQADEAFNRTIRDLIAATVIGKAELAALAFLLDGGAAP